MTDVTCALRPDWYGQLNRFWYRSISQPIARSNLGWSAKLFMGKLLTDPIGLPAYD